MAMVPHCLDRAARSCERGCQLESCDSIHQTSSTNFLLNFYWGRGGGISAATCKSTDIFVLNLLFTCSCLLKFIKQIFNPFLPAVPQKGLYIVWGYLPNNHEWKSGNFLFLFMVI